MEDKRIPGQAHTVMVGRVAPQYIERASGDTIIQDSISSIEVGIMSVPMAMDRIGQNYDSAGLIGLDGLFTPYFIASNGSTDTKLPSWGNQSASGINSYALNPFNPSRAFHKNGVFNEARFFESGHNISFINTFGEVGDGAVGDLNAYKDIATRETADYSEIRSMALRGPVVIAGWGYDTDGDPVPYQTSNGKRVFHADTLRKPSLWKVGPLDVRWDESRGVWAAHGGEASSSGCCECECLQDGDITISGKKMASRWYTDIGPVSDYQSSGYLTLSKDKYILNWDNAQKYWLCQIPSGQITAYRLNGSGINDLVPDRSGTLIFRKNDNGYTTLSLTFYGNIPSTGT